MAGSGSGLLEAVDRLQATDLDRCRDHDLHVQLGEVETAIRRLQAWQTRLAGTAARRARQAARDGCTDPAPGAAARAAQRAEAEVRRGLVDRLRVTPSQAKQTVAHDRRLEFLPLVRAAFDRGELSAEHVRLLDRTLTGLPAQTRRRLEPVLVEAARTQDPAALGRTCRQTLAEAAPEVAMADQDRQHARRSGRLAQRPDGMSCLTVEVGGVDGAWVHAALDAFRRRDAAGEVRTPEQATADAFLDLVRAAAGTIGDPSARHARPVFVVQLPAEGLLSDHEIGRLRAAAGRETFTGPLPAGELARLLDDAHLAGLLADADGLPLAVTSQVRTVPAGLWRALIARDGGCVRHGCDAPAGWCQTAHLGDWHADGGMLALDTAGLLCTRHHRAYDRGQAEVIWTDGRPTVRPLSGDPAARVGGRHTRPRTRPAPSQPPPHPPPPHRPPTRHRTRTPGRIPHGGRGQSGPPWRG